MSNFKPFLFGAVAGALVAPLLGFTALGWKLDGKAQIMASEAATAEVQRVLVPVCVARFKADPDAAQHIAAFKAEKYAYPRTEYIKDGGWATLPGQAGPVSGLAQSCAQQLHETL